MSGSLFDPETGELLNPEGHEHVDGCLGCAQRDAVIETITSDLQLAEKSLRNERRKVKALEEELRKQRQEDPQAQEVQALFRLWVDITGRNKKTTKLGDKREKTVLKALRTGYSYDDCADAIRGAAKHAWVSPDGKRFDDLELILRDETKIERFRDLWRRENPPEGQLLPMGV